MTQSYLLMVLKSSFICAIVSCALGFVLPLCGIYTTITNRLHVGPSILAHAILDPTHPLLRTLFTNLLDRSMATPAAGSVHFPSFSSAAWLHIHVFPWKSSLHCTPCSSPSPSVSVPNVLLYSCRSCCTIKDSRMLSQHPLLCLTIASLAVSYFSLSYLPYIIKLN